MNLALTAPVVAQRQQGRACREMSTVAEVTRRAQLACNKSMVSLRMKLYHSKVYLCSSIIYIMKRTAAAKSSNG